MNAHTSLLGVYEPGDGWLFRLPIGAKYLLMLAVAIVREGALTAYAGGLVAVRADTICLHGDAPGAAARARAVRAALEAAGVTIAHL